MKRRTYRVFLPQNWRSELETVNARSAEGFHLTRCSRLFRTEEEDAQTQYRYALDCRERGGFTELLYEKQGWEPVCAMGAWLWFRKRVVPGKTESEYVLHGASHSAVEAHLRRTVRALDALRNGLLVLALILLLLPGTLTGGWTPRLAAVPLLAAIPVVKTAEALRGLTKT